jgi:hypothetical protein
MTHAALSPLIGSEFDEFLGASIGEDRNGMGLTILSALAARCRSLARSNQPRANAAECGRRPIESID